MPMKSEVYPVELLRKNTRWDSTGADSTGAYPVQCFFFLFNWDNSRLHAALPVRLYIGLNIA